MNNNHARLIQSGYGELYEFIKWCHVNGYGEVIDSILMRYKEPWRHYHVLDHLAYMFALISVCSIENRYAVYFAIIFHDAIYEPGLYGSKIAISNELRSSELVRLLVSSITSIAFSQSNYVQELVLCTSGHRLIKNMSEAIQVDAKYFLDADLAILGSEPSVYKEYTSGIRREFYWYSDSEYATGRSAILRGFLERDRLFFTDHFHKLFEKKARTNIIKEINNLTNPR